MDAHSSPTITTDNDLLLRRLSLSPLLQLGLVLLPMDIFDLLLVVARIEPRANSEFCSCFFCETSQEIFGNDKTLQYFAGAFILLCFLICNWNLVLSIICFASLFFSTLEDFILSNPQFGR